MNDHEIVRALRDRTVGGLTALYDGYAEPIYAYGWSLLGDETAAQEVLAETFVVAEAHIEKLTDPAQLRLWLYAIARNECLRRVAERASGPGGQAAGLDELLATASTSGSDPTGGAESRAGRPGMPGVPGVMVAPGVLGVPDRPGGRPSEEATTELGPVAAESDASESHAPEPDVPEPDVPEPDAPEPDVSEPDVSEPDVPELGTSGQEGTSDHTDVANTPALGIAAALGEQGEQGQRREVSPRDDNRDGPDEGPRVAERVLGAIEPGEREVLELSFRHGLGVPQVALVTGASVQQAQATLSHADQQVRSALAVERLATGGRVASPELAARLERGEPPPAALVLSVRPTALPETLKDQIVSTFTAAEKIGYRLHVGRRAAPFDRNGFPVPLDRAGATEDTGVAAEAAPTRRGSWRWPAIGLGAAACVAAVLAGLLLWPDSGSEKAATAAAPDGGFTGMPAAPLPTIQPSVSASPTATPSASPQATPEPTIEGPEVLPPDELGGKNSGSGSGNSKPPPKRTKKPGSPPPRTSPPPPTWTWTPDPTTDPSGAP